MKRQIIKFDDIITNKDLEDGNLILITGRPGVGKTETCSKIMKKYKGKFECLYFDLTGDRHPYWLDKDDNEILFKYHTSVEIIKKIQENDKLKFVFIDYWQLLDSKEDWFLQMLLCLSWTSKIIFVITSQLTRNVESRRDHLPCHSDLALINPLYQRAMKVVVIGRPAMYGLDVKDELKYYVYKDWRNSYVLQDNQE